MLNRQTYAQDYFAAGYNYDELYRLTSAQNPLLPATESFSYDKVGNRKSSAATQGVAWNYNNNNALIGYDGIAAQEATEGHAAVAGQNAISYGYDANGNTNSKDDGGQATTYTYGTKDRLDRVDLPGGGIAIYQYDPFGRRISKTVDGTTTYFMYAEEGLVAEMNSYGAVTKSYGWMPDGTWGTDPVLMKEGGQTYYYHNDHLGTPQKMTDSSGAVVWSAMYTAFGEATVDAASTVTNNLRFPGQYYDAESGLHYNWFRYYDPKTGTFVSPDPIGLLGGFNPYRAILNNPNRVIDYFGLEGQLGQGTADKISYGSGAAGVLMNVATLAIEGAVNPVKGVAIAVELVSAHVAGMSPWMGEYGNAVGAASGVVNVVANGIENYALLDTAVFDIIEAGGAAGAAGGATAAITVGGAVVASGAAGYALGTWMYGHFDLDMYHRADQFSKYWGKWNKEWEEWQLIAERDCWNSGLTGPH